MSAEQGPLLQFKGVTLRYRTRAGPLLALDGLSLDVHAGDFVCVVGPSGCGKTTLLHIAAGFIEPTEGEALFAARPITGPDAQRGVVFQHPALYPWLTVQENVEFGPMLRRLGRKARARIAEQHLSLVGLWESRKLACYELSGGMQQRVQLARLLANDPDLVLMDEHFGALDALTREHLQAELLRIWRETGKTVLFITHSVEEAVFLGTRVVVLSSRPGRIIFDVSPPFSRLADAADGRAVKAAPEFVALREQVLRHIWNDGRSVPAAAGLLYREAVMADYPDGGGSGTPSSRAKEESHATPIRR